MKANIVKYILYMVLVFSMGIAGAAEPRSLFYFVVANNGSSPASSIRVEVKTDLVQHVKPLCFQGCNEEQTFSTATQYIASLEPASESRKFSVERAGDFAGGSYKNIWAISFIKNNKKFQFSDKEVNIYAKNTAGERSPIVIHIGDANDTKVTVKFEGPITTDLDVAYALVQPKTNTNW